MDKRKTQSSRANQFRFFQQPGSRYYSVRLMLDGQRRRFSTGETNLKAAQSKAAAIMADIKSQGFEAAIKLHGKRRNEIPEDPTIEEFCELYKEALITADSPPSKISSERYIRCLVRVCEGSKIKRVRQLDAAAVERFKESYLRASLPDDFLPANKKSNAKQIAPVRNATSVRTTLNGILRNAAALFSKNLLATYRIKGVNLENPFSGTKLKRIKIKAHTPFPKGLIDRIWEFAPKLRDGDPEAPEPFLKSGRRSANAVDFREPHPAAFAILMLELGLGLRRNEADKAEWQWAIEMPDGRRFFEVRPSEGFIPKSKQSRVIPIDPVVWEALVANKADERYIVPGPKTKPKRPKANQSVVYRCEEAHRVLVIWLRKMGVHDPKPCHALRKEFGSYVATNFSLFHAQKLLGHSTPTVTSAYYASLTDLPQLEPSKMGLPKI
jgi:integrase